MNYIPELILNEKAVLAEGPCWDQEKGYLLWVDIIGEKVHIYNPANNTNRTIPVGQLVGAIVPRESGGAVLALKDSFYFIDLTTEEITPAVTNIENIQENRFNDGKCDAAGRFWAGTMAINEKRGAGSLYYLNPDLTIIKVLDNVTISNGLAWSQDNKKMYYIDSPTRNVIAFDFNYDSAKITDKSVVVIIPDNEGVPDGMTIDKEGMLWVAQWGGYKVSRWNPATGKKIGEIKLPVAHVTSCTFGGENLDELYITTARKGLTDLQLAEQPEAGGIFRVKTDTCGYGADKFFG